MTLLVPFDGTPLSEAALARATEFADTLDEPVVTVTVIPNDNSEYARKRGWIDDDSFDRETVQQSITRAVRSIHPDARVEFEFVDRFAPAGTIANRIRAVARAEDASIVFVGSTNAGEVVSSISSVGKTVAASEAYDVLIVRQPAPSKVQSLRAANGQQP